MTAKPIKLRFYQREASHAALRCLWHTPKENPLIAMPTGTGKSLVIADIITEILKWIPHARITVATHSKELVEQDSATLQRYWPSAPFGIYAAGLKLKQAAMPVTFALIQSMVRNVDAFGKQNILIIDEAHMLAPQETSSYRKVIAKLKEKNPNLVVIGLTATPYRLGQGLLTNDGIFTKICYDITGRHAFVKLIDDGFLSPLIPKPTKFRYDTSKVHIVAGDFNQRELQDAINVDEDTQTALQEALQVAHDRHHWMIFCSGIDHVEDVTAMLTSFGEDAVAVHSKLTNDGERDANIDRFRSGQARMIVNDGILTTGVDFPFVDCILLLRPTASPGLHVQILGRGTRPLYADGYDLETTDGRLQAIAAGGKRNCLVLDFAGNTERCGPINDPHIPKKKKKGTGEIPVKICPKCQTYVHAATRFCDGELWDGTKCDHEFIFETHIERTAGTSELIARDDAPVMHWFAVSKVEYEKYTKPFTPAMMKVRYRCGLRVFSEMVCVEHTNYAGRVARQWWKKRGYDAPPLTTDEGMEYVDDLPIPTHIYVQTNLKWPQISATSFNGIPQGFDDDGTGT